MNQFSGTRLRPWLRRSSQEVQAPGEGNKILILICSKHMGASCLASAAHSFFRGHGTRLFARLNPINIVIHHLQDSAGKRPTSADNRAYRAKTQSACDYLTRPFVIHLKLSVQGLKASKEGTERWLLQDAGARLCNEKELLTVGL